MSSPPDALAAAAPAAPAGESFWDAVREALRGSRRDYAKGPIGRAVLVLAVPMVLEMLMERVFVVCDVFFVAKLGPTAVAVPRPCAVVVVARG